MKKLIGLVLILALGTVVLFGYSVAGANDNGYSRGETTITETVENLDIDWTAGRVTVAYHKDNTIRLEEKAKGNLSEDNKMRWQVQDKTLKVIFNKPGMIFNSCPEKELIVTLPEGMKWKTAKIGATSAELAISSLEAEEAILETTSGDAEATVNAETVKARSTSGNWKLTLEGKQKAAEIGSTSGVVDVKLARAEELKISSTSGGIRLDADEVGKAELGVTSGNIFLSIGKFEDLKVSGTSSSVEAQLSSEPGFAGEITTTSGDVRTELALRKDGNRYSCGDGSARLKIGTTSGDVTILERAGN